jgi:hypothetical protein
MRSSQQQRRRFTALIRMVWGRQLTDREQLVLDGLMMSASSTATGPGGGASSGGDTITAPPATPVHRPAATTTP